MASTNLGRVHLDFNSRFAFDAKCRAAALRARAQVANILNPGTESTEAMISEARDALHRAVALAARERVEAFLGV